MPTAYPPDPPENSTLVDRITHYVQTDQHKKAAALAATGDYLEECFLWEITWNIPK